MLNSLLLAQVESLSGSAGWAGAGLLGLVLAWLLLVHLPAKDKQIKGLTEDFQNTLDKAHAHCDKENEKLLNLLTPYLQPPHGRQ